MRILVENSNNESEARKTQIMKRTIFINLLRRPPILKGGKKLRIK